MKTGTEKLAAVEFEPMTDVQNTLFERLREPEWSATATELGVQLRFAAAIVGKNKDELVAMVRSMPDESFRLNEVLDDWIITVRGWAELFEIARARQLSAACAIASGPRTR